MSTPIEKLRIIEANGGDDNMSGTAMTAKYVSLEHYHHCTIVILTHAWAAGTAAVSVNASSTLTGTATTAQAIPKMWTGDNSDGDLLETAVTSNTFNLANSADQTYVIEIDAQSLPTGYPCLTLVVATPGSNNDYYTAFYQLSEPRYEGTTTPDPTA